MSSHSGKGRIQGDTAITRRTPNGLFKPDLGCSRGVKRVVSSKESGAPAVYSSNESAATLEEAEMDVASNGDIISCRTGSGCQRMVLKA